MPVNGPRPAESRRAPGPFGAGFDYLIGYDHGAPSPGYFWYRKRQKVLRLIERHLSKPARFDGCSAWKAVELGCGDGVDFFLIRRKILELLPGLSLRFIGVDGNPDSLSLCRIKRAYYGTSDSSFVRCDLSRACLPFADSEFDFAYCSEVLEYLCDPEKLIAEVKRILKPRGRFLITTPNEPNVFQRSYWRSSRRQKHREDALEDPVAIAGTGNGKPLALFGHVSVRSFSEWEGRLAQAGFESIDFERGALVYAAESMGTWAFRPGDWPVPEPEVI